MKKTVFFTLLFIFLCAGVWGGDYVWTGGGLDDDWSNSDNWSENGSTTIDYPGKNDTNDTVTIDGGAIVTLKSNIPFALDGLTIDGASLDLGGYSLTADALNLLNGNLNIDNNTLTVTGTLNQDDGDINLTDGIIEAGDITQTGGTINLTNGTIEADSITMGGTIAITTAGTLRSDGTIILQTGGTITGDSLILEANGEINLSGGINALSIAIEADSITGSGTVTASTGDISLLLDNSTNISLNRFNASNGTIFVSTNAKDIVYYSSSPSATPPLGGTWTTPLFVEANSVYGGDVKLQTKGSSNNIYLVDVVDSSNKKLTADGGAGTAPNGFIEFFTTGTNSYTYSGTNANHLDLLPGAGGVRIVKSAVDITGDFKINNANTELTLDGSGESCIKAANITLGDISALNNEDLKLEAAGDILFNGNVGTAGKYIGDITLDVRGDIGGNGSGKLAGKDITVNAEGDISLLNITGDSIVLNVGGNISLLNITGDSVILNAGYPNHAVFGNPGTVTLKDLAIAVDLTIWCMGAVSSAGTKNVTGNIKLFTDDTDDADIFLADFITIGGTAENKLRSGGVTNVNYEFGPANTKNYHWIDSNDASLVWPLTLPTPDDGYGIFITGSIAALGDLTVNTTTGNIVFEGVYDADNYQLNLNTTGGRIIQNGGTITAGELNITAANEAVILARDNAVQKLTVLSAGGGVEFKNDADLEISGITGAEDIVITVNGNINLSGNITVSSITMEANTVTGNGLSAASTGDISLLLDGSGYILLNRFSALSGTIIISAKNQDIVYYSSSTPPSSPPNGETWTTPLFIQANSVYDGNVDLQTKGTSNNIYLVDVVDSSNKTLTADGSIGTAPNGFIEFFTTAANSYTYSGANPNHLKLLPGAGGLRIVGAVVDITGDFNAVNTKLTLDGSGASRIKAANITINGISALNNAEKITLEAGGNITVSGKITAYQLIAKAPTGSVSIDAVEINSSNTGNERENAAIYIVADNFIVTTTGANSIIPGGAGGHLCLAVNTQWTDINGVVDGIEGVPGTLGARWHQHISGVVITGKILYSFTEDSDGNGRLDRIRVQSNYAINGDFSDFDITVEGYVIDRTNGVNGFQMVGAVTGKIPFDYDSFYIYLKENPEIDGGNTPLWSVTRNTSLLSATGSKLGDPTADKNIKPIDTIPPRIAYTLTLPGNPQTYVQMSEPAVSDSGAVSASFDGVSSVIAQSAGPADIGYLFDHSNSYGADELASLPDIYQDTATGAANGYFKMENIVDKEPKPNWSAVDPACPPKYPLNWGYTEYAKVINDGSNAQTADGTAPFADVFTPPNRLLTVDMMTKLAKGEGSLVMPNSSNIVIRRVTDIMISTAPATANSSNSGGDNYFVWPVWAKPRTINAGTIWQFDGTVYIEKNLIDGNNGIELQARIKNKNMTGNMEFFWTVADIPADMRNPKEASETKKVGGLWLPNVSGRSPLYYYVIPSDGINKQSASSSSALFNFDITADALANGGAKFEFIFRFANSDMFAARLDAPPGVIPDNWYALIRPFSFDIQSIRQQRGGVTVMNNVINSDKKEIAYIRYDLPRSGRVTIQIYTLDGSLIKSIRRNENRESGVYVDTWDGTNNGGRAVARGMYFVRVVGPDIDEIRKIMVVK